MVFTIHSRICEIGNSFEGGCMPHILPPFDSCSSIGYKIICLAKFELVTNFFLIIYNINFGKLKK